MPIAEVVVAIGKKTPRPSQPPIKMATAHPSNPQQASAEQSNATLCTAISLDTNDLQTGNSEPSRAIGAARPNGKHGINGVLALTSASDRQHKVAQRFTTPRQQQ